MMNDEGQIQTPVPRAKRNGGTGNGTFAGPDRRKAAAGKSVSDHLINGRYRVLSRIGSGRLGPIHEAADESGPVPGSETRVALQLLDANLIAGRRFTGEFERGVATLRSVSHPNIVALLDAGRDEGRFFLVNELLDCASLRFVLNDVGKLSLEEAAAVMNSVADALQYLHAKSIVHGNLKPSSVLVTFDYEVKLLDVVPPEWPTALSAEQDVRDDVYGLACLTYEILSGKHPFNANTPEEARHAGLQAAPIGLLSVRQWRALSAALELNRELRTPSVAQFLDEFGGAAALRLREIVANGTHAADVPGPAPAVAATPAPAPVSRPAVDRTPEYERSPVYYRPAAPVVVIPDRYSEASPERRGSAGKVLLLFLLLALGAMAYLYRDRVSEEAASVMAAIAAWMPNDSVYVAAPPAKVQPEIPAAAPAAIDDAGIEVAEPVVNPPMATVPAGAREAVAEPPAPVAAKSGPATAASTTTAGEVSKAAPSVAEPPAAAQGPARFGFTQSIATVDEGEVAARIVIRRTGDLTQGASVAWWADEGSAIAERDFADLGARVEKFAPGEATRTVFVPLVNDAGKERRESFNVYLGQNTGSRRASEPQAGMRVDIVDDD
jgi:Protein kinase domain/Calx-beta domain